MGNARSTITDEVIDVSRLGRELSLQKDRLEKYKKSYTTEDKNKIQTEIDSIEAGLKNSSIDEDEKRKASSQLKDLKIKMERMEKEKEMPQLINEFRAKYDDALSLIDNFGEIKTREKNLEHLEILKKEGEKAIEANDKILLARVVDQIFQLGAGLVFRNPQTLSYMFDQIVNGGEKFSNQQQADYFINKGNQAIKDNDPDELKRCIQNLMSLLSSEAQQKINSNASGITTK